ncbi:RNA polymerase sigma factor RpoE [Pandoraea iniqua]|uniref:RNA polymerase sigma factor RpoE n=1 Tax=Pandoraea iniqua TaxID=2508288 RepID=A0A5E4YGL5_9BURK|nr:RNA polymerase sigma factor [Pandoraea iniqua]VVE47844.1 RNA polymerase sigma factor RpoE [Pandoraea iniqua]
MLISRMFEEHGRRIYRFIFRHIGNHGDAEDIAQQVFLDASRGIDSFRGESECSTWLYGIALNQVKNYLNRAPSRRFVFEDYELMDEAQIAENDVEGLAIQKEFFEIIHTQIAALPTDMREIITVIGIKEMSYEEASATLHIPIGTVRSRLSRARVALRALLRERGAPLAG